jgi:hypothetical protein
VTELYGSRPDALRAGQRPCGGGGVGWMRWLPRRVYCRRGWLASCIHAHTVGYVCTSSSCVLRTEPWPTTAHASPSCTVQSSAVKSAGEGGASPKRNTSAFGIVSKGCLLLIAAGESVSVDDVDELHRRRARCPRSMLQ